MSFPRPQSKKVPKILFCNLKFYLLYLPQYTVKGKTKTFIYFIKQNPILDYFLLVSIEKKLNPGVGAHTCEFKFVK